MKQFYNQRWFIDQDYIPDVALDLAEFRQQFCASVRRHLLAEVPFGLLLSGGLDSSLVASIAFREYKKLGNNDVLKSFCIGKLHTIYLSQFWAMVYLKCGKNPFWQDNAQFASKTKINVF